MTSLAQLLVDFGARVHGCDTAENFVTEPQLTALSLTPDVGFTQPLPPETDCVIYTAAHQGKNNPVVVAAEAAGIPVFSHAEALAAFFNDKTGIAVCGVGGKSTTSAMIAWILEKTERYPSYSVGVGEIIGLPRTGKYVPSSTLFVAEADEYASNPTEVQQGAPLIPRFHYLTPLVTVCTQIAFDHPDVYANLEQTNTVFQTFFSQIKRHGVLCCSLETAALSAQSAPHFRIATCGSDAACDYSYSVHVPDAAEQPVVTVTEKKSAKVLALHLQVPGLHNVINATYAIAACRAVGVPFEDACNALDSFASTKRRFEFCGEKNGVRYFDDYAHHPSEIAMVIDTLKRWFPGKKSVIAFQAHTFSRTKQLFSEFVSVLATADEVVMIDIFASARESFDASVSSDTLCAAIQQKAPHLSVTNVHTLAQLAEYCKRIPPDSVCVTVGAGDIYKVHELL